MSDIIKTLEAIATDALYQQAGEMPLLDGKVPDERLLALLEQGDVEGLEVTLGVRSRVVCAIFAPEEEPVSVPLEQPDDTPEQEPEKEASSLSSGLSRVA